MDNTLFVNTLARLLDLNTRAHDLNNRMLQEPLNAPPAAVAADGPPPANRIAEMQAELDQWARAIITTCWLADSTGAEAEDDEWHWVG